MNGAATTTTRKNPIITMPVTARGLLNRRRRHFGTALARRPVFVPAGDSVITDPWVDHPIQEVDDDIDEDESDGDQQHGALYDGIIPRKEGVDQQAPDAGPVEHRFGPIRARQALPETEPPRRGHGQQDGAD